MEGVIAALLGNALIAVAFRFWGAAALETHKSDLASANNAQLERLRAELRVTEGRTGRFDERRFQAVSEVYGAAAEAIDAMERMARPMRLVGSPPFEDDQREATDSYNKFRTLVQKNRLWLGRELAADADAVRDCLHSIWVQFAFPDKGVGVASDWGVVIDLVQKTLPPLRSAFEDRAERMFLPEPSEHVAPE